jgi:hypothetical protein
MSSTGAKGSQQTNKMTEKGFKYREQKTAEVSPGLTHRTVSGAPGSSNSELLTFGNSGSRPAIIHRTVRSTSRATATSRRRSSAEGIKCATVHARVRAEPEGAPDSEQCLSGAPPDCSVAQMSEAPTVRIQRPGDVAGAPDCPVRHTTAASTNGSFGGWGYKYPQPPTIHCIQVFTLPTPYKSYNIQYKTHQRDQILSQVQRSFPIK